MYRAKMVATAVALSATCATSAWAAPRIEHLTRAEAEAIKESWRASRVQAKSRLDTNQVIVPFFVVDTTSPAGVTTLFAVHADMDLTTPVDISYQDLFGNEFFVETGTLAPSAVLTINVRDKNPPPLVAGLAFGRVVIETLPGLRLNGDFYRVNPGENFAQGGGLISVDDLCLIEDVRYGAGGVFDDTLITYHYFELTSPGMGGLPAAMVEVLDEGGNFVDAFNLLLPDSANRGDFLSVLGVLEDLGGGPQFGVFRFHWNPNTVGAGTAFTEVSAEARFSVGVQGACRLSLTEAL